MQKAKLREYIEGRAGYRKKLKEANFTGHYNENSKEKNSRQIRNESKIVKKDFFQNVDVEARSAEVFTGNSLSFLCDFKNRKLASERGITLLALIITVVIMLILAAVTINVTLGDGGLIDQAKHAAEATVNSTKSEQEQMDELASQLNEIIAGIGSGTGGGVTNSTPGGETNTIEPEPIPEPLPDGTISIGEPQWQPDGTANVTVSTTEPDVTIEYQIDGTEEGSWIPVSGGVIEGIENGETVYVRITDGEQASNPQEITVKDETDPTVTVTAQGSPSTNSITVTAQAVDNESGMVASPTYTFQIKQSGSGSYTTPSGANDISNAIYTFTGLTQGTTYDIQVIVDGDNAGNTGIGTITNQTTATVPGADSGLQTGNITASPATWSNYKASTTLTTTTNFQIQYQVNGTSEGGWSAAADSPVTVSNLNHADTVYARLWDGNNGGNYAAINILDGTPPTVNVEVEEVTDNSIAVTVNAADNESGLADSNAYRYYLNDEQTPRATSSSNIYTYEGLTGGTDYIIKVEVVDKANNPGTGTVPARTEKPKSEIEIARDEGTSFETTTELQDDLENPVWIPGGFGIASDSGTKVEEGIVIEDGDGNQFVWIPTGEYNVSTSINSSGKLTNNLSRRTFNTTGATEVSGQIGAFKSSAETVANGGKGGFYIGRYEQGTGNVCKAGVEPYTDIRRNDAKTEAEAMYNSNNNVESELISSYAWDTVLNFICQTNSEEYTLVTTTSSQYGNIGTNSKQNAGAYDADKYSNIHDLLGNCREWTTEYSSDSNNSGVSRGGTFNYTGYNAAYHQSNRIGYSDYSLSFRLQLYIK